MVQEEQADLVKNIADSMAGVPEDIIRLQLSYFKMADTSYAEGIAKHLNIKL